MEVDYIDGIYPSFCQNAGYYAKYEPIVYKTLEVYSQEILFRLNDYNNAHISFLEERRAKKETFTIFTRICKRAFIDQIFTWNRINMNLEIPDLLNKDFLSFLDGLLRDYKVDTSMINFEILENDKITEQNRKELINQVKELSKRWFNIVIDDLFSWYSDRKRVEIFSVEGINLSTVKIDWKFMQKAYLCYKYWYRCDNLKSDLCISDLDELRKYIWELKSFWINIVAEWIETEDMLEFAKSLWIDYFQWYLFQDLDRKSLFRL